MLVSDCYVKTVQAEYCPQESSGLVQQFRNWWIGRKAYWQRWKVKGASRKKEGSMTFREEDESNRTRWLTWQAVQEKLKGGRYFYLHLECLLVSI